MCCRDPAAAAGELDPDVKGKEQGRKGKQEQENR